MFPRRGAIALIATAAGLALLLSFKTPELVPIVDPSAPDAIVDTRSSPGHVTARGLSPQADGPGATSRSATNGQPATPGEAPPGGGTVNDGGGADTPLADGDGTDPTTQDSGPRTVTGAVVRTRFGDVQVAVTADASGISAVEPLRLPGPHFQSQRISQIVEPILRREALQAQGASIDWISGATFTSRGYAMSLQSALDQLG